MENITEVLNRLNKIEYKFIESEVESQLVVEVKDHYTTKIETNNFTIIFTREIRFEPRSLYSLVVEAEIEYKLEEIDKKTSITEEFIEKNINELLANKSTVLENVSQLISNISSSMGRVPIITPPIFISQDEEKTGVVTK